MQTQKLLVLVAGKADLACIDVDEAVGDAAARVDLVLIDRWLIQLLMNTFPIRLGMQSDSK